MSKLAFVFPGQGAQFVGMGKDFYDNFEVAKKLFDEADDALGYSIKKMCFEGSEEDLKLTANTQPAILIVSVIAAGGFADSRGMAAAFALGAHAIQMGSRFVVSKECIAHPNYKEIVLKAKDRSTVVTGRTLGHPVRVIANKLTKQFFEMEANGASNEELEQLGVGKLNLATHKGDVENGSVMIGQISGMLDDIKSVQEIIDDIVNGLPKAVANLQSNYL